MTADAGYAYAKVYAAFEKRGIDAVIPAKAEPIRSRVPMRRFRYDAKNDILKCPKGRILRPKRPLKYGASSTRELRTARAARSRRIACRKGAPTRPSWSGDDYPALLRARRRRERWSAEDRRLYQRHRWRSEGFHGEAKSWHGLARAIRRGLANMKIQAYLTAAAINLKRLAAAFYVLITTRICARSLCTDLQVALWLANARPA